MVECKAFLKDRRQSGRKFTHKLVILKQPFQIYIGYKIDGGCLVKLFGDIDNIARGFTLPLIAVEKLCQSFAWHRRMCEGSFGRQIGSRWDWRNIFEQAFQHRFIAQHPLIQVVYQRLCRCTGTQLRLFQHFRQCMKLKVCRASSRKKRSHVTDVIMVARCFSLAAAQKTDQRPVDRDRFCKLFI